MHFLALTEFVDVLPHVLFCYIERSDFSLQ